MKKASRSYDSQPSRRAFIRRSAQGIAGLAALGFDFSLAPGIPGRQDLAAGSVSARQELSGPTAPAAPSRLFGLMADAARVPEDVSYYRRLIDFCHDWNLNALLLSLTDDQGSALRFKSHPELITHQHALAPDEARILAAHAQSRGVELIPIIESFGHTRYITGAPEYAHLADQAAGGKGYFNGLIPVAPESLRLMTDIYREAAELFPSRYFHGGCDEVNWGGSELSRKALESRSRAQIWADYLNALDGVASGLGKEFIVWGDYVLHKEPDILPLLLKNIIVMDWQYSVVDPRPLEQAARQALRTGLRAIGAPAIISCRWGPRAGAEALENIAAYADAYRRIEDPGALGVIVTNWIPCRYIQQSLWDSFAYSAVALTEGAATARDSAFRRFVQNYYGAEWTDNWADIFTTFYDIAPPKPPCAPRWLRPVLPVPWWSKEELKAALDARTGDVPPFARLVSQLARAEASVQKNLDDFLAFRLSAEYIEHLFWRNTVLIEEKGNSARTKESAAQLIETIAERDERLLAKLDAAWNRGRPSDAASKLGPVFDFRPGDQLLFTFRQAAAYSAQLARQPEEFFGMLSIA